MSLSVDQKILSCFSWSDFLNKVATAENTVEVGRLFERLTQLTLKQQTKFSSLLTDVWLLDEAPQEVITHLGIPSRDEGIDLICRTKDNKFWAVQCKFKSDHERAVTSAEVAKFSQLAFVVSKGFALGIVSHTSSKRIQKSELIGNCIELGLGSFENLTRKDWEEIHRLISNKTDRINPRSPRADQVRAIEEFRRHYEEEENARGKLIMPCGTGKTLLSFWCASEVEASSIIVIVPSLTLLKQTVDDWSREFVATQSDIEWITVCGDESTSSEAFDQSVANGFELGLPNSNDPLELASFLKRETSATKIFFSTYHSAPRLAEAFRAEGTICDLIIFDEAHKTVGNSDSLFSQLLHDDHITAKRRLFMTATERVVSTDNEQFLSMDDTEIYGDIFFQMSFKEAIDLGLISDYRIVAMAVSSDEVDALIRANEAFEDVGVKTDARNYAANILMRNAIKKYGLSHVLSFHRSVKNAEEFLELTNQTSAEKNADKIQSFHVNGKTPAGRRAKTLKEFQNRTLGLLTNARCLTEGVDIPNINAVIFVDPKQSKTDIVQAAGRAMRNDPDNPDKVGTIIIPMIISENMSIEDASSSSEFKTIALQVAALSGQDERIVEELSIPQNDNSRFRIDLSNSHAQTDNNEENYKGLENIRISFANAIRARTARAVGRANWRTFSEAKKFAQHSGASNWAEWKDLEKPIDIPVQVETVYANKGWINIYDFLGQPEPTFVDYNEAVRIVRELKILTSSQYTDFQKSPEGKNYNLPSAPDQMYLEWISWPTFLGTDGLKRRSKKRPFAEARELARKQGLKRKQDYYDYYHSSQCPSDMPLNPDQTYKENWDGWPDFLGFEPTSRHVEPLPFEEAREFVRSLNLRVMKDFRRLKRAGRIPINVPTNPHKTYKDKGWVSNGDWLGTGSISNSKKHEKFPSFLEFQKIVREKNIKSGIEYRRRRKAGEFEILMPHNPDQSYKEFTSWFDILGQGKRYKIEYRPWAEIKEFAQSTGIDTGYKWRKWIKTVDLPLDIPVNPANHPEFIGWGDFLGTGNVANYNKVYRTFEEARKFARSYKFAGKAAWFDHWKENELPKDIPIGVSTAYKDKGWTNWPDFLGSKLSALQINMSYQDAQKAVQEAGIKSFKAYLEWRKLPDTPDGFPSTPAKFWKDEWSGTENFFGRPKRRSIEKVDYATAKNMAKAYGVKTREEWLDFKKRDDFPVVLPQAPDAFYKGKGWNGWKEFLDD